MSFYMPEWQDFVKIAVESLNIGSNCVICGRTGSAGRDCNRAVTGWTAVYRQATSGVDLCDDCESLLQRCQYVDRAGVLSGLCLACGEDLSGTGMSYCANCQQRNSPFKRIIAPYRYSFPVDKLVHALKFNDHQALGRVFGCLLARAVRDSTPDDMTLPSLLIPVPLHPARLSARGFNQAAQIARWCARDLGLSAQAAARRDWDTGSLAGLSRLERQHRILGAFRAEHYVAGRDVAIVDDVLTTGSTARELARELYDTGAASVELWVLARTSSTR